MGIVESRLVVFKGFMGAGKSTLSRAVGQALGWPVVDKDDIADVLVHNVAHYGPLAYEAMWSVAGSLLKQGFSVICDSPLRGEVGFHRAKQLARESGAALSAIVCVCSDESLWHERFATRRTRPAHLISTPEALQRYAVEAFADFNYEMDVPTFIADTVVPLSLLTEQIVTWLMRAEGSAREE